MSVASSERAREACESCRKSHKRCAYDDNSTRCLRCEKRNTPCSLFLFVETTAVAQQDAPASVTTESAPDSWDGTSHDSAASSNLPYPLFPPQAHYYLTNPAFTESTHGEYPADMISGFQSSVDQHENTQPAVNQDGLCGCFSDRDGALARVDSNFEWSSPALSEQDPSSLT